MARERWRFKCCSTANYGSGSDKNNALKDIDPNMGLSQMACVQMGSTDSRDTKFGPCQIGSYLCYQASKSNFKATASIDCIPRLQAPNNQRLNYPRFPLRNIEDMVLPGNLSDQELQLIHSLKLDEEKVNAIERETRQQAASDK